MRKQIKALEEKNVQSAGDKDPSQPLPSYLLDRNNPQQAKSLSSAIKNRRSEKSARYSVPIPKVSASNPGILLEQPKILELYREIISLTLMISPSLGISEEDMFKVIATGKRKNKLASPEILPMPTLSRIATIFVFTNSGFNSLEEDDNETHLRVCASIESVVNSGQLCNMEEHVYVKYERFIRPMGLRYKKAHVTHPELNVTVQLPIISVKKNPQQQLYTQLGVLTKGTIIEVNVSELGLTTAGGKVVWGRCTS
ncbi:hypothetical protein NUW58_g6466 [Xylaria curta]|uniref:Uncharacterized protein n=1 Tax=Xylaria curta TaxID=42375 RepID=A0ACC1NUU2_9PEZI|nr:hypothetical protein NUW58_g6466 [Xylaria curta]